MHFGLKGGLSAHRDVVREHRAVCENECPVSVCVQWSAVPGSTDSKGREFPILGYWVSYQPGGNTNIGFGIRKYAPDESCRPTAYPFYKVCCS